MSFYTWKRAVKVFFCRSVKPEPKKIRYWYSVPYHGRIECNECAVIDRSIPAIEHHPRCLTGKREKARRIDNPGPLPPRKATPFQPRMKVDA